MIPQKKIVAPGLVLDAICTERFKTEILSIAVTVPLDKVRVPFYGLVLSVLKRGTEKYPTIGDINRRLDELYAAGVSLRLDRFGNNCMIGFSAEMLGNEYADGKTDIFGGVLEVITEMLFHPLTTENGLLLHDIVESEKMITCDAIEASANNPKTLAARRCRELVFGDDDYGAPLAGTVKQISQVTADELTQVYRELLTARTFRAFYVGSQNIDAVGDKIYQMLAPYLCDAGEYTLQKRCLPLTNASVKRADETTSVAQGKLVIGFRTGIDICHKDFYSMLVLSEIYGGSPVSKLFMNVRERLSLCYYCSSTYDIYKGTMFVSSGVDPEARALAEAEIFRQLDAIRDGEISDGEFDAAIKALVSSYRAITDLPATLETYYFGRDLFGVACTIDECIEKIRNVRREDVIRIANAIETDTVYFLMGDTDEDTDEEGDADEAL